MAFTLALDIGTSGVRAAVFTKGVLQFELTESAGDFPLRPISRTEIAGGGSGRREVGVDEMVEGILRLIGRALDRMKGPPGVLIPGAAMHTLVLLDEQYRPLSALLGWTDSPSFEQNERWRTDHADRRLYRRTGCPFSPVYPLYRLLQLREEQRALFERIRLALSLKSYLLLQLTGVAVEDYSTAGASGMFNIETGDWDKEALNLAGLLPDQLPRPVSPLFPLHLAKIDEETTGKIPGPRRAMIPLIQSLEKKVRLLLPGSSDGALAHLGSAGLDPGIASLTIGSSGAVRLVSDRPVLDPGERFWCYPLDDRHYIRGVATNNGGNVLSKFAMDGEYGRPLESIELLDRLVSAEPFDEDLLFSPYLFPERLEFLERMIRHDRAGRFSRPVEKLSRGRAVRVVLEALAFHLTHLFFQLDEQREVREIVLSGGVTRSRFMQRLLAELLPSPVRRLSEENSSLVGAWRMAATWGADPALPTGGVDLFDREKSGGEGLLARETEGDGGGVSIPAGVYQEKYSAWLQFVFCSD